MLPLAPSSGTEQICDVSHVVLGRTLHCRLLEVRTVLAKMRQTPRSQPQHPRCLVGSATATPDPEAPGLPSSRVELLRPSPQGPPHSTICVLRRVPHKLVQASLALLCGPINSGYPTSIVHRAALRTVPSVHAVPLQGEPSQCSAHHGGMKSWPDASVHMAAGHPPLPAEDCLWNKAKTSTCLRVRVDASSCFPAVAGRHTFRSVLTSNRTSLCTRSTMMVKGLDCTATSVCAHRPNPRRSAAWNKVASLDFPRRKGHCQHRCGSRTCLRPDHRLDMV